MLLYLNGGVATLAKRYIIRKERSVFHVKFHKNDWCADFGQWIPIRHSSPPFSVSLVPFRQKIFFFFSLSFARVLRHSPRTKRSGRKIYILEAGNKREKGHRGGRFSLCVWHLANRFFSSSSFSLSLDEQRRRYIDHLALSVFSSWFLFCFFAVDIPFIYRDIYIQCIYI